MKGITSKASYAVDPQVLADVARLVGCDSIRVDHDLALALGRISVCIGNIWMQEQVFYADLEATKQPNDLIWQVITGLVEQIRRSDIYRKEKAAQLKMDMMALGADLDRAAGSYDSPIVAVRRNVEEVPPEQPKMSRFEAIAEEMKDK